MFRVCVFFFLNISLGTPRCIASIVSVSVFFPAWPHKPKVHQVLKPQPLTVKMFDSGHAEGYFCHHNTNFIGLKCCQPDLEFISWVYFGVTV